MKYFRKKLFFFIICLFYCSGSIASEDYDTGLGAYEGGDYKAAYEIWQKSAQRNNTASQYGLGYLFEHGIHVNQDFSKALFWYEKAALAAHPGAQYSAGNMYLHGLGTSLDQSRAVGYFSSAAQMGNEPALLTLGDLNFYGELPDASLEQAIKWYQIASDIGSDHGAAMVGLIWYENKNFQKSPEHIISQFEYALALGSVDAEVFLGLLYKDGGIVDRNLLKAQAYFESAIRRDPDVYTTISLAEVLIERGEYSRTIRILEEQTKTLGIYAEDQFILGTAHNLLGRAYANQSELLKAQKNFMIALNVFTPLENNISQLAMALNNLALTYLNLANFTEAEKYLERAVSLQPQDGVIYNNFGIAAYEQGKYDLAKSFIKKSLSLLTDEFGESHIELTAPLNSLGIVYSELDEFMESEFYYKKALDIIQKQLGEEHQYYAITFGNLANVWLSAGQFEKAFEAYNSLINLYENSLGSFHQEYAVVLNNLANLKSQSGNYADGIKDAEKALDITKKNLGDKHPDLIGLNTGLAKLHFHAGDIENALHYSNEAGALINVYLLTLTGAIGQNFELVRPTVKLQLKTKSIDIQRIQSATSFNIAMLTKVQNYEKIDDILISLQLVDSIFSEAVFTGTALRLGEANPDLKRKIRLLQDEREAYKTLSDNYVGHLSKSDTQNLQSETDRLKVHLNQKLHDIVNIQKAIELAFPSFNELVNPQPLSLTAAQNLFDNGEGLFTFVSDDETEATYAFFVTKDDARAYEIDLSESDIAAIVGELRAGIDLSNSVGFGDLPNFDMNLSYDLYSKLFGPVEDMLESVKHLLVVPTGPLESLPLNLLITEKPDIDPTASVFENYQAAAWLPKTYSLTRLPSVSSLRALRVFASAGQSQDPFIGFGDPVLDGPAGDLRGLTVEDVYQGGEANIAAVRNLPELPETSEELKRIAAYLGAPEDKIYLRERASETVLKNTDLTNSRVVAFATHGLVGGEISGLAEPALVLSPPSEATDEDDGLLKASEVAQLKMNADMVLLSACNTASGDELGAEGLSGLARAFIYAGARSLLVSHWSVESTSAAELTTGLFDAINQDQEIGRSEALQRSMIELMTDKVRPYYSHPAFWAPFSLIGDGQTAQLN